MNDNKKQKESEQSGGTPAWMVTFSDLSTLLLTFFVLLLSMASMDEMTLKCMFSNFTQSSGILNFKELGAVYHPKEILIEGIYERLKDALVVRKTDDPKRDVITNKKEKAIKDISSKLIIEDIENGFKLIFGHRLMFSPGSAHVKEDMNPILGQIAKFIKTSNYQIYIDGHTDNIPIHNAKFSSNVDLSIARALNIMNYLVKDKKITSSSIALAGYGELCPVSTNDTTDGREKNRRVEMIFKNQKYF